MKAWASAIVIFLFCHGATYADKWEIWENCRLLNNEYYDGDSFKVRKDGGHYTYILRLYFVDAAETDKGLEERMQEQSDYWGISLENVYKLGKEGARFTERFLKDGFTVYTKKQKAMGRSEKNRYYALVEADGVLLSNALVSEGLARLHGQQTTLPKELPSATRFRLRLKGSEKDAKTAGRGGWGMDKAIPRVNSPRSLFASPTQPSDDINLPEQVMLRTAVSVFSTKEPGKIVGTITPGITIHILSKADLAMHRVRFTTSSDKTYEALIRTSDLRRQLPAQ